MNISLFHSGICQWVHSLYCYRKLSVIEKEFLNDWYQNKKTLSEKHYPYDWEQGKLLPRLKFIYKNLR